MKTYTPHEVAEIIADLFGDSCACNFNGINEWLPEKCELLSACPNPVGAACWEQYLKHRKKNEASWKEWYPGISTILTGEEMLYMCSSCSAKYPDVEGLRYCPHCGSFMSGGITDAQV